MLLLVAALIFRVQLNGNCAAAPAKTKTVELKPQLEIVP